MIIASRLPARSSSQIASASPRQQRANYLARMIATALSHHTPHVEGMRLTRADSPTDIKVTCRFSYVAGLHGSATGQGEIVKAVRQREEMGHHLRPSEYAVVHLRII